MTEFVYLTKRNVKLFFKDKGTFFTSLITPLILILLFVTFLGNVYRDALSSAIPEGFEISKSLTEGFVGGWLFSSLLAVSCITVAFCSNMLSVSDKVTGARNDLNVSPVKNHVISLSYFTSSAISTLIICYVAFGVCLVYLGAVGFYLSVSDLLYTVLDVFLLVLFGTSLSSIINLFLSTQGQISAVGTIVSSCYGFISGAYMPLSQFGSGIQVFVSFLPGTYGTALLHHHLMRGAYAELEKSGLPAEAVNGVRGAFDGNTEFFGHTIDPWLMYLILGLSTALLIGIYVLLSVKGTKKK